MPTLASIGLALPLGLLALPIAVAALIYAYRRRGQGTRVLVGSILLLKSLQRTASSPRTFVLPPRFFFELLLALLLILGACGLFLGQEGARYAVVIDNSLSMAAHCPEQTACFEAAKSEARSVLLALPGDSRIALFATSPAGRQLSDGFISPNEAVRTLRSVAITYAADNIESYVTRLLKNEAYERVLLFTDRHLSRQGPAESASRLDVHSYVSEKEPLENLAISAISQKTESPAKTSAVRVELKSFARRSAPLSISLFVVSGEKFLPFAEKTLTLEPQGIGSVIFSGIPEQYQQFKAELKVAAKSTVAAGTNALSEDDSAYLSAQSAHGTIYLVSRFSAHELGLDKITWANFQQLTPEQYEAGTLPSEGVAGTVIFHRVTPVALPRTNALFVAPSAENDLFKVEKVAAQAPISRWRASHPILTYLSLAELTLRNVTVLSVPDWARDLLVSTEGTAAFAGELEGSRYVALGFEVFPFEGKSAPTLSILTLNVLKWLSDLSTSSGFQSTYSSQSLAPKLEARYLGGETVPSAEGKAVFTRPGLVAIEGQGKSSKIAAVNYFAEEESNLARPRTLSLPQATIRAEDLKDKKLLSSDLALCVLLLLLADATWLMLRRAPQ